MKVTMKVKINYDVPVNPKHGIKKGRIFDPVGAPEGKKHLRGLWVMGDLGIPVLLHRRDYTEVV